MSRLSPSCRSRLRRLIVVVLAGLTPVILPAGVTPAGAASYPLYSSRPLAGTAGTPGETTRDPDHPHRQLCYKSPCTEKNAVYAEEVRSMALAGNRLFLGGFFSGLVDGARNRVQPSTPFLAELDATTGRPAADQSFARNAAPDGTVEAMLVAGGRLYVGGRFSRIGGGAARRIAALDLQTGKLDPSFHPPVPSEDVLTLALSGGRLFIGGEFLKVGSADFAGVAALNADNGSLVSGWFAPKNYGGSAIRQSATKTESTQGVVRTIAVTAGGKTLMVGGTFMHLGHTTAEDPKGNRFSGLIALNTSDGRLSSWKPLNNRPVYRMATSPNGATVYAVEGGSGGWIGAFRPGTVAPVWIGRVDGDVLGIAATDKRVYVGGHFDAEEPNPNAECLKHIPTNCVKTGTHHRHLVAFDMRGKSDPKWTAQADTAEGPTCLLAGPKALYVGGNFKNILEKSKLDGGKGIPHPGFALFPASG
jgi:outer membrane protein assembly factor BamB